MTVLESVAASPLLQTLGWTLLHSLWLLAVIALLLVSILLLIPARRADLRSAVAESALLLSGCVVLCAFVVLFSNRPQPVSNDVMPIEPSDTPVAIAPIVPSPAPDIKLDTTTAPAADVAPVVRDAVVIPAAPQSWLERITPALPWVACLWMAGTLCMGLWHAGGYYALHRIRRAGTCEPPGEVIEMANRIAATLGVRGKLRLLQTSKLAVPAVLGLWQPVVLVPASLISGLPAEELRALLAHEIAHLRRHDHLWNFLQIAVETALFYHPAIWWMSRQVRWEREGACDDVAVGFARNRFHYARVLVGLAEQNSQAASWRRAALAADGGPFLRRIHRLLNVDRKPRMGSFAGPGVAFATLVLLVATVVGGAVAQSLGEGPAPQQATDVETTTEAKDDTAAQEADEQSLPGRQMVAFSPDGKALFLARGYRQVIRMDAVTGKESPLIEAPRGGVFRMALSPDGKLLVTGGTAENSTVRLWNAETGKQIHLLATDVVPAVEVRDGALGTGGVAFVAFSPDGKTLACGLAARIGLVDIQSGEIVRSIEAEAGVDSVAFSPDGKHLAGSLGDGNVGIWETATGELQRKLSAKCSVFTGVQAVAFSGDGQFLATAGQDGRVRVWDFQTGAPTAIFGDAEGGMIFGLAISPSGKQVATAQAGKVALWDIDTGKQVKSWEVQGALSVTFSPDGKYLAWGGQSGAKIVTLVAEEEKPKVGVVSDWSLPLIERVPPQGAWARFEVTGNLDYGGLLGRSSLRGTLTIRSLEQAVVQGKKCRWIEYELSSSWINTVMHPSPRNWHRSVIKLLVPEEQLQTGGAPLQHTIETLRLTPDGKAVKIGEEDLQHGLWSLLAGKELQVGQVDPATTVEKGALLEQTWTKTPYRHFLNCPGRFLKTTRIAGVYRTVVLEQWRQTDEAPFGVAWFRAETEEAEVGVEAAVRRELTVSVAAVGNGAVSAMREAEIQSPPDWMSELRRHAQRQRLTVEAVKRVGGSVVYARDVASAEKLPTKGPQWLRGLVGDDAFDEVSKVILDSTEIEDISLLESLTDLTFLDLIFTDVKDLSPLRGMNKLEYLALSGAKVEDLTPLRGCKSLRWLKLDNTSIADLTPLAELQKLENLDVSKTSVTSLAPLARLPNLKSLLFSNTKVSDLTPLKGLNRLETLYFQNTPVRDLKPLLELPNLKRVELSGTPVENQEWWGLDGIPAQNKDNDTPQR